MGLVTPRSAAPARSRASRPCSPAALTGGADVSATVRLTATIKTAITGINENAWTMIEYTDTIRDESTGQWISRAQVAEIPFTAQKKANHVPGRLVVRLSMAVEKSPLVAR